VLNDGQKDPRVDEYVEKSPEFARPILRYLRSVVHAASPDVEETIKWHRPFFDYKGVICYMAAFRHHCAFGFWKAKLNFRGDKRAQEAMGHLGRVTRICPR